METTKKRSKVTEKKHIEFKVCYLLIVQAFRVQ